MRSYPWSECQCRRGPPAYAGIAAVWIGRQQQGVVPSREATPLAKAAAEKSLQLDSTLAQAHHVQGMIKVWSDWSWGEGERAFQRAIALNPNYPDARAYYSLFLMLMNRPDEAFAQIERALELDPSNFLFQAFHGMDLMFVDRFDEAVAQFRNTLETTNFPFARNWLSKALHKQGMHDEALAEATAYAAALGDRELEQAVAQGYAEGGYPEAMRRTAETLAARSDTTYVAPWRVAGLYALAGESDRAFQWLERAYDVRDPNMPHLAVVPHFDSLHDDPRFQDLLRRMNLPGRVDG